MIALTKALESVASGQQDSREAAQHALEMARKQQQPDNITAPQISVYNPQGEKDYPRPKLKCRMFIPWEAREETLSWEEIELLNLLQEGEYKVRRNDGTYIKVTIRVATNMAGRVDKLLLNHETAYNNDNHWLMPPMVDMLRSLAPQMGQKDVAAKILTMDERIALVEAGSLPVSVGA